MTGNPPENMAGNRGRRDAVVAVQPTQWVRRCPTTPVVFGGGLRRYSRGSGLVVVVGGGRQWEAVGGGGGCAWRVCRWGFLVLVLVLLLLLLGVWLLVYESIERGYGLCLEVLWL